MKNKKFILKTIADCLVAGLISVGVFQSPTFAIESLSGYAVLIGTVLLTLFLMTIYALKFHQKKAVTGLSIALVVSMAEIYAIGLALGKQPSAGVSNQSEQDELFGSTSNRRRATASSTTTTSSSSTTAPAP